MRPKWRLLAERRAEQVLRFVYVFGMSIVITCATLLFMSLFGRLLLATACSAAAMAHPHVDGLLSQHRHITVKTEVVVDVSENQPTGERFPETLFIDAFPVIPGQETLPDVFDLRAFAEFQNQFGTLEYGARPYDYKYTFKYAGPIYGAYEIKDAELNPSRIVEKWADLLVEVHKGCRRCFDTNCDGHINSEDLLRLLATRGGWSSDRWWQHMHRAFPPIIDHTGD